MPSNIHHDEERGEEGKLQEAEAIVISNVLAPRNQCRYLVFGFVEANQDKYATLEISWRPVKRVIGIQFICASFPDFMLLLLLLLVQMAAHI